MLKLIRQAFYLLLMQFPFLISSCSTFDPPLVVPAYGHIDSIHFYILPDSAGKEGTASALIPYAWVYLDDNPVGAFQMPGTFPMIAANGVHNIKIYPGILPAGGSSAASMCPFYQYYSININLQQGTTTKFQPSLTYYDWVAFPLLENFESEPQGTQPTAIINSTGTSKSDTTMLVTRIHSLVFEGQGSGIVVVKGPNHENYVGMTTPPLDLPANGSTPVYMELNYKATTLFSIGLYEGDTNYVSPLVVYPSPTWTKMYVVFQNTLSTYSLEPDRIYFAMSLDTQDGHTKDTLLIDNIKILD
jgi:hypothetical protein